MSRTTDQRDIAEVMPRRTVTRRRMLAILSLSGTGLLLHACAPSAPVAPPVIGPTAAPAAPAAASPVAPSPATSPSPGLAPLPSPAVQASPAVPASPAAMASPAATSAVLTAPAAPPAVAAPTKTLRVLSWQAPNQLNPFLGSGQADQLAARCCLEPLLTVDNSGRLEPVLAAEIPTAQNGGLPDNKTVIYKLRPGITWADGQPFTADDVAFTYNFIANPETAATTTAAYRPLASVEALDPLTVKLTFKEPTGGWYVPFVGGTGSVLPKHAFVNHSGAAAKSAPFNLKAFGTGPFMVDQFAPGDSVVYVANPRYRTPGKPGFARVELKGGGDATTAARAVLQTNEFDYAWNLQVEGPVLESIMANGKGQLVTSSGAGVELLLLNQADPNVDTAGERSAASTRHPFLTEPVVRQAMALAIDRPSLAAQLYGNGVAGTAAASVLTNPSDLTWTGAKVVYDLAQANDLLDKAGYPRGADGIRRTPAGARMAVLFATSVNSLRQKQQAIIKEGWQKLGIDTQLKAIDSGAFFGSASNADAVIRFEADVEMLTVPFTSPFPAALMKRFYGKDPANDWAQKSNNWVAANIVKWADPQYDRIYDQALTETDPTRTRALWQRLDELSVSSNVVIPLVDRKYVGASAPGLSGPAPRAFDLETWNIADWTMG